VATVLTLEKSSDKTALRLLLAGSRLVIHVKHGGSIVRHREHAAANRGATYVEPWSAPTVQRFPSSVAAQEHLDGLLRLRKREGYEVRETREITGDEAGQIADEVEDPLANLVRNVPEHGLVNIGFNQGPVSPETCVEVVARVVRAAPSLLDYSRRDDAPGGLLGAALAGQALPSVKSLIHTVQPRVGPPSAEAHDDVAVLIAALPNLERVFARGRFTLGQLNHGKLCELYLCAEGLSFAALRCLGGGSLPALSTVGLSFGDSPVLAHAAAIALTTVSAPRLRAVIVTELTDVGRFLADLARRPLPPSWETLHLQGIVVDEDALLAVLGQCAPSLRSLGTLGLPLSDHVSQGAIAEAKARMPSVVDTSDMPNLLSPSPSEKW
jgi:hypothetical protein